MGKTGDTVAASPSGQVRIEYIEGRRAVRVTADDRDGPVEIPLNRLIEGPGVDRREVAPPPRLVLFVGGRDLPRSGAGVGRPARDGGGRRQQRLRLVAENGHHPAARASRGHLRTVRY